MASEIVKQGFDKAGYEYLIIDDCWLDHKRDANGKLQPDSDRFPSGIKALADYVSSLFIGITRRFARHGHFRSMAWDSSLEFMKIMAILRAVAILVFWDIWKTMQTLLLSGA